MKACDICGADVGEYCGARAGAVLREKCPGPPTKGETDMTYEMRPGDQNVVSNIRFKYKDRVKDFSDVCIAEAWQVFSQSEDYGDDDKYLEWLETIAMAYPGGGLNGKAVVPPVPRFVITRDNVNLLLDSHKIELAMRNGTWREIRRNGATKYWKKDPMRIRVPYRVGFRDFGAIETSDFLPDGTLNSAFYRAKP